jgi:hypothetical protein
LLTVAVVHEHDDATAVDQPGQERDTVLGVDDHVGARMSQRAQADARQQHRQPGPDVHRVGPAAAAHPDAVDDLAAGRAGIARGAQRDVDAVGRQLGADALQIGLAAAALRVPGVAPAQHQDRADGVGRHRAPA